jgi:hypothetical protein
MDHGHANHRLARLHQQLIIFAQPTVAVEPPQRTFYDPAFREDGKALSDRRSGDNLQVHGPMDVQSSHPVDQRPRIRLIRPDPAQPGELVPEDLQRALGPVTVLHTGCGDHHREDQPERIDEEVAFAPFDLFVRIEAADPPFSVVLTDWLSMIPALGCRRLPAAARTSPHRRSCMCCQVPSFRQRQKYC